MVIPAGKNRGFIEVVSNAKTLYEIKYVQKLNLLVWLSNHNQDEKLLDLRDRFVKSCAFYCLVGYLFGIGDRHSRNILITEKGQLFHIDFGYILGDTPRACSQPEIKLTREMLDCMGGETSPSYHEFRNLCKQMYQCLRPHIHLFLSLLAYLSRQKIIPLTCQETIQRLEKRFLTEFAPATLETKILVCDTNNTLVTKVAEKVSDLYHFYLPHQTPYSNSTTTSTYSHSQSNSHSHHSNSNPHSPSLSSIVFTKDLSPPSKTPLSFPPPLQTVQCVLCHKMYNPRDLHKEPESYLLLDGELEVEIQLDEHVGNRSAPIPIPIPIPPSKNPFK